MKRKDKLILAYFMAIVLGLLTGLVGSVFQLAIRKANSGIVQLLDFAQQYHIPMLLTSALLSMVMVLLSWLLVQHCAPEAAGSGIQEIEGVLVDARPIYWRRLLPVKFISGTLAIASKMVMGREGPTIQMGGNIGDMLGELAHFKLKRRKTLIAAGAAAGLAVAFNAPLAGVIFVIEEMRKEFHFSFTNFTMAAISCVTATMVYRVVFGSAAIINMPVFDKPGVNSLGLFVLFGVIVGVVGLCFNITLMKSLKWTDRFKYWLKMVFIMSMGALVGCLYIISPDFVGGGYEIIDKSLSHYPSISMLIVVFFVRFILTMACYSTGIPGGIFAPMLALGTVLGLFCFYVLHYVFPDILLQPGMFAVAGMGALFAASVRAPITGIVLVVELTQNYNLILPLMITCLTATTIVQLAGNAPIYSQLLVRSLRRSRA